MSDQPALTRQALTALHARAKKRGVFVCVSAKNGALDRVFIEGQKRGSIVRAVPIVRGDIAAAAKRLDKGWP